MAVALHGNLRDFGMGEVFQLIGQQRKTGVLAVRGRNGEVELRFDEGRIVSAARVGTHEHAALGEMLVRCGLLTRDRLAELEAERERSLLPLDRLLVERGVLPGGEIGQVEDLLSRETLFDLLRWSEGSFRFIPQPIRHRRDPTSLLGAEQVLMDGLRMIDEWRSIEAEIPEDSVVLKRVGTLEECRRSRAARGSRRLAEEEKVLLLVDGRLPARRVIDLSRLGTFECARILVSLIRAGLVEPTAARRAPRPARTRRHETGWRRPVAILAAFGFLGGVLALAALPRPAAHWGEPRFPIHRDALREARVRFEVQRLRNLAQAFRFAQGRAPRSAGEVVHWGHDAALTRSVAGYYHDSRGGETILLAPEY